MSEICSRFDVIVLGVGAMGSATCLELARRGKRVLGLERHAIGHGLGSSHGGSRIIRECYFEAAEYVPLLLACREGWERLEHDAGQQLVHRPGVLYAGGPQSEVVRRSLTSGATHGVPCELWTAPEAMRRFPQFHLPDGWGALFEPGAGFVRPERAVLAATALARSLGAEVHESERATAWSETPSGVRVTTDRATYEADSLVIAAGAWTPSLARELGVRLQPLRVAIAWLKPALPGACASPRMPVWYIDRPGLSGLYGIPTADDQDAPQGVKVATHGDGTPCDPDQPRQPPTSEELESMRMAAAEFVPCAADRALTGTTCLYTMSPDQHFVVDRMPDCARTFVACGFSGHGFKFMPVMGRVLADLACDGATSLPIGFLAAKRFAKAS